MNRLLPSISRLRANSSREGELRTLWLVCVNVADESASWDIACDEFDRSVSVAHRWLIVKKEHQTGDDLHDEEEEGQSPHIVSPGKPVNRHFLFYHHGREVHLLDRETLGEIGPGLLKGFA